MADFEVFSATIPELRRDPSATIQKNGLISLNQASYEALERPRAVELLFDRARRVIGLRAANPALEHARVVRGLMGTHHGSVVISAAAFLRFYGVLAPVSRRWGARLDGAVLCIDLATEFVVVTSNRAGTGSEDAELPARKHH